MAVGTGYTTGIRSALNEKGVTNDRITYDQNKGVMIDGNTFYRPEKVYQGTSYTSPTNFTNAWSTWEKQQQQPANTQQQPTYNYNPYASNNMIQNNPYTSRADEVIQQLLNYTQNQRPFDPYSTSAYQAAQAQAQRAAQQNTRAAQEAYGGAGFGRSTALGERVAGINNDATEYLMTQVLPQIEAQEQARRQQEFANMMSILDPIFSQQSRADNLVQQDFNNRITQGELLGTFRSPEMEYWANILADHKGNTEQNWMMMSDEQRAAARAEGDRLRAIIDSLGGDSSLFGADVTSANARGNLNRAGIPTLAARGQQFNQDMANRQFDYGMQRDQRADFVDDRNYNRGVLESDRAFNEDTRRYNQEFEYTQGRDAVKDAQWQQEFNRILQKDGVDNALRWANLNLDRQREARLSSGGGSGQEYTGGVIQDVNLPRTAATMETWIINNIPGGRNVQGPPPADQRQWIETQILNNPNLSENDMIKLYNRFGIPLPE